MSLKQWLVFGGNLYLGVVCLGWPFMVLMGGFAFDAPSDTISAVVDLLRHVVAFLIFLYPVFFLITLGGSIMAYRADASMDRLLLWFLPACLTPPPWILLFFLGVFIANIFRAFLPI